MLSRIIKTTVRNTLTLTPTPRTLHQLLLSPITSTKTLTTKKKKIYESQSSHSEV